MNKHKLSYDKRALKEYLKLPRIVQHEFDDLILLLEESGFLSEPEGKKLKNYDFFEIRVRIGTSWRGFYSYLADNEIIFLSFFQKKSKKTPGQEIHKALSRLKFYK